MGTSNRLFPSHDPNRIDFVGLQYENVEGQIHARGFEAQASYNGIVGTYTYTQGNNLFDVPNHAYGVSYRQAVGKGKVHASWEYTGPRDILLFDPVQFNVAQLEEDGHHAVSLYLEYPINNRTDVYVRVNNALGEDYREGGFRTPGTEVYGGVRVKL